jgi:DNA-binding transcriptional LysR family regulator
LINSTKNQKGYAKMHSWDDFRVFLSVAETGSFSASARELGVNHSTISRRVQSLEKRHGVKLFERTQKGYRLTVAGQSILSIVGQAKEATNHASRLLSGHDDRLEGEIKLTMPHEIFDLFLAKPLAAFSLSHPKIQLNIGVKPGLKNIANREADLAVRITPEPPEYLIGKRITYMQHALYASPQVISGIERGESVPLVLWPNIHAIPSWASDNFGNAHVAMYVDDLTSMHKAVKAGVGLARMPCFYPDSVICPEVVKLDIPLPLSDWGLWLLNHVDLRNSARIRACKQIITEHMSQYLPVFLGNA